MTIKNPRKKIKAGTKCVATIIEPVSVQNTDKTTKLTKKPSTKKE